MKNIEVILSDFKIELSDENKTAFIKAVNENYKTIAEVEKKDEKIQTLTEKMKLSEDALKKFEGVDTDKLNDEIANLKKSLADKDAEYSQKLADRDFNDLVKESIASAKGKNAKAITALLDIETLKGSKNQKDDIDKAIKALTEAEDSKMLFGEPEQAQSGRNPIGSFTRTRTTTTSRDEMYKDNPYYHSK